MAHAARVAGAATNATDDTGRRRARRPGSPGHCSPIPTLTRLLAPDIHRGQASPGILPVQPQGGHVPDRQATIEGHQPGRLRGPLRLAPRGESARPSLSHLHQPWRGVAWGSRGSRRELTGCGEGGAPGPPRRAPPPATSDCYCDLNSEGTAGREWICYSACACDAARRTDPLSPPHSVRSPEAFPIGPLSASAAAPRSLAVGMSAQSEPLPAPCAVPQSDQRAPHLARPIPSSNAAAPPCRRSSTSPRSCASSAVTYPRQSSARTWRPRGNERGELAKGGNSDLESAIHHR